jgi:RNA polymerase sigma-70 factor, ECF subfamily
MERPDFDDVERLIAGLAAGDERAFAALYDRFGVRLYRTAIGIVRRREDAEDVVQEVFLGVFKSKQRLRDVRDLTAYLFTALRRAAGRTAAASARGPVLSEDAVREAPAAASGQDLSPMCGERLQRAISALPPEQREVLSLKIDGELTFAQIGQVFGVSMNTAASRYRYALEKLRATLEEFK